MTGPVRFALANANTRASYMYTAWASAGLEAMALSLQSSTSPKDAASAIQRSSLTLLLSSGP